MRPQCCGIGDLRTDQPFRCELSSIYFLHMFPPSHQITSDRDTNQSFLTFCHLDQLSYFIIKMLSTLFEQQVFLGFPQSSPLETRTFQTTFVGGQPLFFRKPHPSLLECTLCLKQKLTFICQIFCPLDASHAYNRVLYVLYCQKCERVFRCIKQQAAKEEKVQSFEGHLRVITQSSFQVESSPFEVKELQKIMKRAKLEVQEETIEEMEDEDDDDEEGEDVKELDLKAIQAMGYNPFVEDEQSELSKEQLESLKHAAETREQQSQRDQTFQQYKKVMVQLDGPVLLYSNIPIPYNSQPINPHHFCKHCNTKLSLQLQLTERLLQLNQKLLRLDWGSLMVFTCANSCKQSEEECVVVQYEVDAVKDEEVQALRKRQKNKKRKEMKEKSREQKEKSKSKGKTTNKEQQVKIQAKKEEEGEGDWD